MIFKSYLVEENINLLKNQIVLFYGENIGLLEDFKDKIKLKYNESEMLLSKGDVTLSKRPWALFNLDDQSFYEVSQY